MTIKIAHILSANNSPSPISPQTARKDYTAQHSFTLKRPDNNTVTFIFDSDSSRPHVTRCVLPPGSTWTPSPHWHERYTEYVQCVSGRLLLRLDGVEKVITPTDDPQTVDKYVVHEFMRADVYGYGGAGREEEDVVVDEWTDPADGVKQVFFRNLCGVLEDREYWGFWLGLQVMLICSRYDNYDVLWGGRGKWVVTHAALAVVDAIAWTAGLRPWYREYTPAGMRAEAEGTCKKIV